MGAACWESKYDSSGIWTSWVMVENTGVGGQGSNTSFCVKQFCGYVNQTTSACSALAAWTSDSLGIACDWSSLASNSLMGNASRKPILRFRERDCSPLWK